jgi:hypothetical protein
VAIRDLEAEPVSTVRGTRQCHLEEAPRPTGGKANRSVHPADHSVHVEKLNLQPSLDRSIGREVDLDRRR